MKNNSEGVEDFNNNIKTNVRKLSNKERRRRRIRTMKNYSNIKMLKNSKIDIEHDNMFKSISDELVKNKTITSPTQTTDDEEEKPKIFTKQTELVKEINNNGDIYNFIVKNLEFIDICHIYTNNETIFHIISSRGLDEILDLIKIHFKKQKIKSIIKHKNNDSLTALHEAACYGYKEICENLIDLGANIDTITSNGNTPIHFAIVNGHVNTVQFLIQKNSRLDIQNNIGKTPYKLLFKHMKQLIDNILNKKKKYLARVSLSNRSYIKNKMITDEELIYDRNLQKISFNSKIVKKKNYYCCCCTNNTHCNFKKVVPINNNSEICRRNSSEKDSGTSKLSGLKHIKDKRILVEYDYTEICDRDIVKFIRKEKKEIVTHPWFQTLMDFYWYSFGKKMFISQLGIYVFYTLLFTLSSVLHTYNLNPNYNETLSYNETMNNNETMSNNITNYLTPFLDYDIHYLTIVFDILILFLNTFYLVNEISEIKKQKTKHIKSYFMNRWNIFDMIQILLIYITIPLKIDSHQYKVILISILYPIFFIKFLNFSRGFRSVGPIVRTIFKMLKDIYNFMAVLFVFLIGFSQSFFILLNNNREFQNPLVSILTTFDMIIGGFDIEILNTSEYIITCNILYRLYIIISVIMLLNILIAILENSYTKISEEAENEWKLERAKLIISLMDNLLSCRKNKLTVENINSLRSLELDNKPIKGIENFKLEI